MPHTPGPWKIEPVFIAQTMTEALHFGEYRFPHKSIEGSCLVYPRSEAEANARLMEAAPDLLHSLKWIMAMLECGTLVRNIERDSEPDFTIRMAGFVMNLGKAQESISKAEGRE